MASMLCRYNKANNSQKRISDTFCLYNSNDFSNMPESVAKANKSGMAVVKVIGTNLPRLTDWTIKFNGEWRSSPKFGYTFFASSYELLSPSTEKGLIKFLSSKSFPTIGQQTAKAIVDEFGKDTLDVIEKNPTQLLRVPGITLDKIGIISESYKKNISFSKLCSYLAKFGISQSIAAKINEKYGDKSLESILNNPYVIQNISGIGFTTCEKIARAENKALDSIERIEGGIIETIQNSCDSTGDMLMLFEEFETKALKLLNNLYDPAPVSLEMLRNAEKNAAKDELIVFRSKKYVFLKNYDQAEDMSAKKLATLLKNKVGLTYKDVEQKVNDYCATQEIKLSEKQIIAVEKSLMNRVSIITGGPGTGKTTIIKTIIHAYQQLNKNHSITLLAPTGKAARRMSEATECEAHTIHSKLMLATEFNNPQPIETGLIIVDETSMVDNLLLDKLLRAVSIDSQLIFVGDIDQLPSVGAGAVLAEMINSERIPTSRLTEIFRQKEGGVIVENAIAINTGNTNLNFTDSFKFIQVSNEEDAIKEIKNVYIDECKKYGADEVALLTPLRRTQNGRFTCVSDSINKELQNAINPTSDIAVTINGIEYHKNDRVLQWKNTEKSSNGDIGVINDIIQTDDGVLFKIHWDNGNDTEEDREDMSNITLAYAISIHKSQGSEYQSVIIPLLSKQICQLFKRNLLYTGVTRGKKYITLVGDKKAIEHCINNSDSNKRLTLLSQRILSYCA